MAITALYAGLAALLLVFLSWRVVQARQRAGVPLGDGGDAVLTQRIRVQGNAWGNAELFVTSQRVL